jgi:tetratricopeptide (TPR) repeat protein
MQTHAQTLSEQGKAEFQKKQYASAAAHFQQCLELLQAEGLPPEIAEVRNNLSVALLNSGDLSSALDAVLGTEEIFAQAGDQQKQGMALANTGSVYAAMNKYDLALEKYQLAVEIFKACGEKQMRAITLRSISDLQLKTGQQLNAVATLQSAYAEKSGASFKDRFFASALGKVVNQLLGH